MPPPSQRESPPPIDEEIYPDHEEELFRRAVSERELLNDEEDAKWWFRTLDRYKREAEMVFEGEPQRVRWHVETKLYMKTCKHYLHPKRQQRLIDCRGRK
jgi:hypothetical protein